MPTEIDDREPFYLKFDGTNWTGTATPCTTSTYQALTNYTVRPETRYQFILVSDNDDEVDYVMLSTIKAGDNEMENRFGGRISKYNTSATLTTRQASMEVSVGSNDVTLEVSEVVADDPKVKVLPSGSQDYMAQGDIQVKWQDDQWSYKDSNTNWTLLGTKVIKVRATGTGPIKVDALDFSASAADQHLTAFAYWAGAISGGLITETGESDYAGAVTDDTVPIGGLKSVNIFRSGTSATTTALLRTVPRPTIQNDDGLEWSNVGVGTTSGDVLTYTDMRATIVRNTSGDTVWYWDGTEPLRSEDDATSLANDTDSDEFLASLATAGSTSWSFGISNDEGTPVSITLTMSMVSPTPNIVQAGSNINWGGTIYGASLNGANLEYKDKAPAIVTNTAPWSIYWWTGTDNAPATGVTTLTSGATASFSVPTAAGSNSWSFATSSGAGTPPTLTLTMTRT